MALSPERARKILTPWKPGQSGNLKGRGHVKSFKTLITPYLNSPAPEALRKKVEKLLGITLPETVTGLELMGLRNLSDSIDSGRTDSQNILLERTEGKITNPVAFTGTPPPVFNLSGDAAKEVVEKLSDYSKKNENNPDIQ